MAALLMQRPERVSDWTDFLPFGLMSKTVKYEMLAK